MGNGRKDWKSWEKSSILPPPSSVQPFLCPFNKYKCFFFTIIVSQNMNELKNGGSFSSVLETNTINKAERKREGLVYITRLQKNFSAPTAKVVWLFSRCLFMWKDLGQNHSPLPEDTYPFPLKEKTNLWELETAKKDMFWVKEVTLSPKGNIN